MYWSWRRRQARWVPPSAGRQPAPGAGSQGRGPWKTEAEQHGPVGACGGVWGRLGGAVTGRLAARETGPTVERTAWTPCASLTPTLREKWRRLTPAACPQQRPRALRQAPLHPTGPQGFCPLSLNPKHLPKSHMVALGRGNTQDKAGGAVGCFTGNVLAPDWELVSG